MERELDTDLLHEMLLRTAKGDFGPSLAELKSLPNASEILRSEDELRQWKGKLHQVLNHVPKIRCMAPVHPPCTEQPIRSHSIQRRRTLEPLSEGTGHVWVFKPLREFDDGAQIDAMEVGIKRHASVFFWLCGRHDAELFRPVDLGELRVGDKRQLLLLGYRAVLREAWQKLVAVEHGKLLAKQAVADTGVSKEAQAYAMIESYDLYLGLRGILAVKRQFEKGMRSKRVGRSLVMVSRRISAPGFAVNGFFTPRFGAPEARIHKTRRPFGEQLPWATLDVSFCGTGGIVSIIYPRSHQRQLAPLVREMFGQRSEQAFMVAVWECVLRNIENLAIAPSAWDSFSDSERKATVEFFRATIFDNWVPSPGLRVPGMG